MTPICAEDPTGARARDYVLGSFVEDDRMGFEDHLVGCEVCTSSVLMLDRKLLQLPSDIPAPSGRLAVLWSVLERTVLRPVPAFGYLVATVMFLALVVSPPPSGPDTRVATPSSVPLQVLDRPIVVRTEETVRGADARRAAPVQIPVGAEPESPVHLVLRIDLDEADRAGTVFRVEIRDGRHSVWSGSVTGDQVGPEGLHVLVAAETLSPGTECEIAVVIERAGDPLDGEAIFRRSVRVGEAGR